MRYPDGGGLSLAARVRRETLRMQAARLFAEDVAPVEVAARLRVSMKSAYQWRRGWRGGGGGGLAPAGPGGRRRGCADLDGAGGSALPARRRPAAPAARRAGARAGRARLGRSALDPGPDHHVDRPAVPPAVHPARDRVSAPTAWASRRSCRGTARGERDEDAIAEWRTLTWAKVGG